MQKKTLGILFFTLLLDTIGTGMVLPLLPVLFTDPHSSSFMLQGYSQQGQYFMAGLITALFGLMQFLAAPLLGELSDVYGRKKLLTLGVGVLALSQMLFGFGIQIHSVILLLFARTIAGIAAANLSIAQATIADITKPEERAKNFGLIGAAFGTGFIIGPLLGGWMAGFTGSAASPFWLAAFLGVINVMSVSLNLSETHKNRKQAQRFHIFKGIQNIIAAWKDKDARPVYLASFLHMSGFTFYISFMGVLLVSKFSLSEAEIGTYFGAVGVCVIISQVLILRVLTRYYRERQIIRITMLCVALSVAVAPFAPTVGLLYLLVPFLAIPNGLTFANMVSLVSKSVSSQRQGAALGINSSLLALAQGVIPLAAGVGSGLIGITAPFITGGLLILVAWSILFIFYRV